MSRPRPKPLNGTPRSDYGINDDSNNNFNSNNNNNSGLPSPSASERAASVSYTSASDIMPLGNPTSALYNLDQNLKSKKWNVQFEALNTTRALALHHQDILYPRLHAVTAAVVLAADSLRSSVAKNGLMTLNDMAIGLQSRLSTEGSAIGYVLIKRAADTSNKFVSETACGALSSLVTYCPGSELLKALVTLSSSKNASQRIETVKSLSQYVQTHGFDIMDNRERGQVVKVSAKMSTDSKPQTRQVGRELIWYCKNNNLLQANFLKSLAQSEQQAIQKVIAKGPNAIDGSSTIGSPSSVRSGRSRSSPNRRSRLKNQTSRNSARSNNNNNNNIDNNVSTPVIYDSFSNNDDFSNNNRNPRKKPVKPASNRISRENIRRRNEQARKQQEAMANKEQEHLQRREQHRRKTGEMAERGRQRAYERLQLQKRQEEEERSRLEMESRQKEKVDDEKRRRQQRANEQHRRRTKERLAEYRQKQKLEADAEDERQRRLAEAQNRIKAERSKQAKVKADNERRKMHQLKRNAPRTETKLVSRKRASEIPSSNNAGDNHGKVRDYYRNKANNNNNNNGNNNNNNGRRMLDKNKNNTNVPQNRMKNVPTGGQARQKRVSNRRMLLQQNQQDFDEDLNLVGFPTSPKDLLNDKDHDYYLRNDDAYDNNQGYDDETIDDVYINDALEQVRKSQGERHKAKYVRQNIVRSKNNRFDATTKAEKNYAWKDDMNQIDYDVQDFEDDLNDALEYHPNIPKRGGTALRNELSALGLDGIDNMGSKRTKSSTNNNKKSNRPQRKLLQLNEVGSYEYGAHGQLVPEGTLAWQQQQDQGVNNFEFQQSNEPLSPLSRFIRQSDSQELAAYKHSVSHTSLKSGVSVSPAPIVRNRNSNFGGMQRGGGKPKHWNTMSKDERKLMEELAGLDQKLETNRRKQLKSTRSEPAYVARRGPRQVHRQNSIATAGIGSTRRNNQQQQYYQGPRMQQQYVGHQMMSQSPSGAWKQRQVGGFGAKMMMKQAAMNNATKQYGNVGGNMYNYQPSYGNAPGQGFNNPVYHDGIAYYYPNQQQQQQQQQRGGGNLSQQYNQQIGY